MLLLDEPLSAIDEQYREEVQWELSHLQREFGFATVYVTHDQREAMSLADRILLMRDGRIVQVGTPPDLLARPVDEFAGHFIGSPSMNFIDAVQADGGLLLGEEHLALPLVQPVAERLRAVAGEAVRLGIRPQHVTLAADGVNARVVDNYSLSREHFFDFAIGDQLFVGTNPSGCGDSNGVRFDPAHLHFFDPTPAAVSTLMRPLPEPDSCSDSPGSRSASPTSRPWTACHWTACHWTSASARSSPFSDRLAPARPLRVIAGLERADAGRIEWQGRDLTDAPPAARDVGMVLEGFTCCRPSRSSRTSPCRSDRRRSDSPRADVLRSRWARQTSRQSGPRS